MKALIIGGSGGLSGRLAHMASAEYEVWAVTRGIRPLSKEVHSILADRNNEKEFETNILQLGIKWDVVFDCICMDDKHALQDIKVLTKVTNRLVIISTDSVYDPRRKQIPQNEEGYFLETVGKSDYAANKRKMEKVFLNYFDEAGAESSFSVTIFRPGHIFGPGFLLGCFPEHSREKDLQKHILKGKTLSLVAGGIYLIQPIYVDDLAQVMLDCVKNTKTFNQIFCIGGPDVIENKTYYEILGELLGVPVKIKEIPQEGYVDIHPELAGHLCHRMYDLSKLQQTGVPLPTTGIREGLKICY